MRGDFKIGLFPSPITLLTHSPFLRPLRHFVYESTIHASLPFCDNITIRWFWTASFRRQASALRPRAPITVPSKTLTKEFSPRDSFYSCPDLSALQISPEQHQNGASVVPADGFEEVTTEPSRAPTPDPTNRLHKPRKLSSTRRQVSKRARGVLGKVRTFHKVAAAKMAHPTIKIDTNVQATKRGPPGDEEDGLEVLDDQDNPGLDEGDNEHVPPFLCQSALGWFLRFALRNGWLMGSYCRDPTEIRRP